MCMNSTGARRVKSEQLFSAVKEIISGGCRVKISVTGDSMYPFLRSHVDSVELGRTGQDELKRGDIVLYMRENAQYVLHRVIRTEKGSFYAAGDAHTTIEGPLSYDKVAAVVTAVWRKTLHIECSSGLWRLLSALWLLALPFRGFIISSSVKIKRVL